MKQFINGPSMPTAQICINKSRLKVYNKESVPTYYLQKGQEFQIELFNPTSDTILAKIYLNGKKISQGGLVLRPGERVFLERYLDVAKKFLFDTYEVANTAEVQKAIEDNGDFKVEFFKEQQPLTYTYQPATFFLDDSVGTSYGLSTTTFGYNHTTTNVNLPKFTNTSSYNQDYSKLKRRSKVTLDDAASLPTLKSFKTPQKIETGRVEAGSQSSQEIQTVNKTFEYFPFHTMEYKLLPVSQKINTAEDIKVKVYCTNCGAKLHKDHKFCGHCGTKT